MAVLSTHLLNTYNGDHAGFVKIEIYQIKPNGKKKIFIESETDSGGRMLEEFNLNNNDLKDEYEMVILSGKYFSKFLKKNEKEKVVSEIVIRFKMRYDTKKYHIPLMISPNNYSVWWSR